MRFSNRFTPPTDADFACPPGIIPGHRLPDDHYMETTLERVQRAIPAPQEMKDAMQRLKERPKISLEALLEQTMAANPGKTPARAPEKRREATGGATETNLFDF